MTRLRDATVDRSANGQIAHRDGSVLGCFRLDASRGDPETLQGGSGPRPDDVAVGNLLVEFALRGLWVPLSGLPVWCFDVLRAVAFEPEGKALDGAADKVLCPEHSVVVVPLESSGVNYW